MANISRVNLQDKNIRELEIREKQYRKAVGNPKELYIWVNPSGGKNFFYTPQRQNSKIKRIYTRRIHG
ncbi:hypothetical protein [Campylobacter hyointestinalis]|uniref:DUF4102 domain-containing protein n=1 Tax=Campylobacter hyointestinalis subsp. hyointestinalis TaxID=91352 RepID=A0A855N5S3_CAMHY|nr:hypothetical protein [Campylobacter hyointestinalis]PPB56371.1 hypothetical protein CDQ70_08935 [Campylobacter hyointestinalis subsp. hyointestinalis]PPB60950.1 hypothetical protein CDQ74_09360 [Campylobacter hyointestinalis subsp. hyointestinalis]PPB70470.1 hypothetical protein CDQ78_08765 [Campylobacter hyointestinalis subsp. hyointestinalis]SUX01226.1 phage integrase family site specific recombinase [Campylobacter hyointestinalis]